MSQREREALLASCAIFAGLAPADLARLAGMATMRRYARGQIVFVEGDSADSLLVVSNGTLKAYTMSPHGEEFLLALLGPGETIGELSLADGLPRSASVTAVSDAVVLRLPREAVLAAAAASPAVSRALLGSLAALVRRLTDTAGDLVFLDVPRRVAKFVLAQREKVGRDIVELHLTQSELAARIGSSRQSINTALGQFQRRGWVAMTDKQIHVLDPEALARFVGD